jgi:ferritin-like metal-binding protein YciE
MSHLRSLQDLLVDQLQDIYDAENQLIDALPAMANAAFDADLQQAFSHHLEETREHANRLREVFRLLGVPADRKHCKAMAGLIKEGEEVLQSSGDRDVLDAALIAAAQRVEHYEIAAYGTVKAFAKRLDHGDVGRILDQTLGEEGNADKKLTKLAEGGLLHRSINKEAANA